MHYDNFEVFAVVIAGLVWSFAPSIIAIYRRHYDWFFIVALNVYFTAVVVGRGRMDFAAVFWLVMILWSFRKAPSANTVREEKK